MYEPSLINSHNIGLFARYHKLEENKREPLVSRTGDISLGSQRPITVATFLEGLYNKAIIEHIKATSFTMWATLEESWINFSHFSEEIIHKEAYNSLTSEGLFSLFFRGRAIQCRRGQAGIDLVIPMAILPKPVRPHGLDTPIQTSHISAIIIQVKSRTEDAGYFPTAT